MESTIAYVIPESSQKPKILTLVPSDPGSRYKTKQIQVQTVGKSKMIKSFFLNINEVAKSMKVPPSYIVHFIAYSIGAQAKYDVKKPERQQAFLTGEHDTKDLSKWTVQFINEVLLCPTCGLPELLITVEKNIPTGSCRACGSCKPLPITNERFKKHIINHPPAAGKEAWAGNSAQVKKAEKKVRNSDKRGKKGKKEEDDEEEEEEEEDDDDDNVVWYSDTSAEATKKRREQLMAETDMTVDPTDEVEKAAEDTENLTLSEKEEEKEEKKEKKEKKPKKSSQKKEEEGKEEEFDSPLSAPLKELFSKDCNDIQTVVKKHQDKLSALLDGPAPRAQFLEWLVHHLQSTKALNKIAHVVKEMYDVDLLEEEDITQWYGKNDNQSVKTSLAPLIKWFQEAEEESEEEEEDE